MATENETVANKCKILCFLEKVDIKKNEYWILNVIE